ncbi:hypothetical protein RJ639_022600 [Escallonia herrerae]|uniref:Transcription factor TFIIB cyclin-like domain-containing protein n=1 Tax=Escallonia herrerae TaxID=1293975 RepID=A0AA88V073_9ASTE|nr:hypothetical protein RJ639_022600 [Escallonia herrerae]
MSRRLLVRRGGLSLKVGEACSCVDTSGDDGGEMTLSMSSSSCSSTTRKGKVLRSPISICAAVISIVTQLSDDKKPLKDVAIATGVVEGKIRNSYKDLYYHLSKIIPGWYVQEKDLKNLCSL